MARFAGWMGLQNLSSSVLRAVIVGVEQCVRGGGEPSLDASWTINWHVNR